MEKLSFDEAKRLSIKKWQMHVDAGGRSFDVVKDTELSKLPFLCGFCARYYGDCESCEFGQIAGFCNIYEDVDLFSIWGKNETKENAESILNVIKNLEENK